MTTKPLRLHISVFFYRMLQYLGQYPVQIRVNQYKRPIDSCSQFHSSKKKLRWTSIKCFHDNSPVLLSAVEFVSKIYEKMSLRGGCD